MHLSALPQLFTTKEAPFFGLSVYRMRQALRTGELAGDREHWFAWDPSRRKFLKRERWRVSTDAVVALYAKRAEYEVAHQSRTCRRRKAHTPHVAKPLDADQRTIQNGTCEAPNT